MSKRVYEIARELDLSTKEVIGRLNDAGIEVKSHLAVVEDPLYEMVFGDGSDGAAVPNGRSEAQEAEALASMSQSPRKRLPTRRVLVYILAATLALAVAAGVGALAALIPRGDLGLPASEKPRQSEEQANAQQSEKQANSKQSEANYTSEISKIQSSSVETFLDSHDKLLRYDALTANDVAEMQANEAALEETTGEISELVPPRKYEGQHQVFRSAVDELHEAVRLAYSLAADPVAATESGFDEYDSRVNDAAALLKRSNEMLGRDFETIEDVREISPELGETEIVRNWEGA
jgi:hypothetical protein